MAEEALGLWKYPKLEENGKNTVTTLHPTGLVLFGLDPRPPASIHVLIVDPDHPERYENMHLPIFSVDLHELARRSESETSEWVDEKLNKSILRYRKFFSLAHSGTPIAPTRDIDMIWHLHMQSPVAYYNDCMSYLGRILDHDGGFGKIPEEAVILADIFEETSRRWEKVFGEPYVAGADTKTRCWHDCVNRCWHACSTVSASEVVDSRVSA